MITLQTVTKLVLTSSAGEKLQGTILKFDGRVVTFELLRVECFLRTSEVLAGIEIIDEASEQVVYRGKAIIQNLIDSSTTTWCEMKLAEPLAAEALFYPAANRGGERRDAFLARWQNSYRILPEYKLAVADLQTLLFDLRRWLDHAELSQAQQSSQTGAIPSQAESELITELQPALTHLFRVFEEIAAEVSNRGENLGAYHAYCRRHLHQFVLASPFMNRIFTKPLGYAGDYEMMNMINRNTPGGQTVFARLLDAFLLAQAPADAVRNRVEYFCRRIGEESHRAQAAGRTAKIWSLGCGPAREVQHALARFPWIDDVHFRLLDFNDETLAHTRSVMAKLVQQHGRRSKIQMVKQSVHSLLKEVDRGGGENNESFDMIYCSGLYDYLSNKVCKKLDTYLYKRLAPGGVLIVTNFDPYTNIRNIMEHIFDWFLIYRDASEFKTLAPEQADEDDCFVVAESSGCNIFLEARKRK